MDIRAISAKDTYSVRNKVLRPEGQEGNYKFQGDNDEGTFHLGGFVNNQLVSVASFFLTPTPHLDFKYQYRLRGMATLDEFQGQGFSKGLLKTAFPTIKQNQCEVLWCNARKNAIGFYESIGFEHYGEFFEIPKIGPHQLMYKEITNHLLV